MVRPCPLRRLPARSDGIYLSRRIVVEVDRVVEGQRLPLFHAWLRISARNVTGTPTALGNNQYVMCGSRSQTGNCGPLST